MMIITIIESCARAKPEVTDEILVYNLRKKNKKILIGLR